MPEKQGEVDARAVYAAELRQMLPSGSDEDSPDPVHLGARYELKRRRNTHRAAMAYALAGLYATVTLLTLVSLIAGWAEYEELRDFLSLVYGALTGLVGAAIGLLSRRRK